jgi:hypothetical protein
MGRREEAIISDFDKAMGEDMLEEPAEELQSRQGAVARLTGLGILVFKGDLIMF